jgi:hypothetical protein
VHRGIDLLETNREILCVLPLSGPPREDGELVNTSYRHDPRGYFEFRSFTSRIFLLDTRRLAAALPLPFARLALPMVRRAWWELKRRSTACPVEDSMTARMGETGLVRADLDSPNAWSLHIVNKNSELLETLPALIRHVERGRFPLAQAGRYDLDLDGFRAFIRGQDTP